tara:strand:- start:4623 stop:4895 length:273 start_codon:yes stop_codon:yes gene_type:complete
MQHSHCKGRILILNQGQILARNELETNLEGVTRGQLRPYILAIPPQKFILFFLFFYKLKITPALPEINIFGKLKIESNDENLFYTASSYS